METDVGRRSLVIAIGSAAGGASLLVPSLALAQASAAKPPGARAGVVNFVIGEATIADGDAPGKALTNGTVVSQGQTIETGATGEVHVVFDDGGLLALRPSSRIQIDKAQISGAFSDTLSMNLLRGALRSITGWIGKFDRNSYQLRPATATVGIRGTDHEVAIIAAGEEKAGENAGIHNWVHEGGTTLTTAGGHTDVEPNHAAWAGHNGQAPQAHQGIPAFLAKRATAHERRINTHAQHINEHIERRMQKRGMIKRGETLKDAQQRHANLPAKATTPEPTTKAPIDGSKLHKAKRHQRERSHEHERK